MSTNINVTINWLSPKILQKSIIKGILNLTLQDPKSLIIYKVNISRIGRNEYRYEDIGVFTRFFSDLDYLLWEFELPIHLKNTIERMPIIK